MILEKTKRTTVKRNAKRANYDKEQLISIIDEAMIGHLAFTLGEDTHSIPLLFWHYGGHLYCHAAISGRLATLAATKTNVCISFVILDGIVLAKSALHHSMNYRSAAVYGNFELISDQTEMTNAFKQLMDLIDQQRWQTVRPPNAKELNAAALLKIPLNEAVVKQRTGFAEDKKSDLKIDAWTGIIPITHPWGEPQPDQFSSSKSLLAQSKLKNNCGHLIFP
ncbi:MAG: pyridoxamine 5'-phosphate oxidase family protein [Coxiellaceae bacterium]|nr:pyridoxamine 5'-phosphate oxidase family protein [Coxiellaceae bacterium]